MSRPGGMAAVILAAGRSSRMGASKALLPLGATSVVERVVGAVRRAQVHDIVVVTGHEPERLAGVLAGLPVRQVRNAGYDAGMFSSVRTGVAALREDVQAFFILPADYPLVRTEVLDRLIDAYCEAAAKRHGHPTGAILHPTCCGHRGHPPLIAGCYRDALLQADGRENLRGALQRHAADEAEVEVEDLTILMDMDTEEDYQRICRFAAILDGAGAAPGGATGAAPVTGSALGAVPPGPRGAAPALASEDALYLLSLLDVPDRVVRHCRAVAAVAEALALALKPHAPALDVDLVRNGALLHDLARASTGATKHALAGMNLLGNLGLTRLSSIVGTHMVLAPEHLESPLVTEEQLVYLADKLVAEDRLVGLEERTARTLRDLGGDDAPPGAREGLQSRMRAAEIVLRKVEAITRRPLADMLG